MNDRNYAAQEAVSTGILTCNRRPAYSLPRGVNADSPPSSRRLASKFCFYSLFSE
jgi:hypothetical protein